MKAQCILISIFLAGATLCSAIEGPIVERNVDLAAEAAFDQWAQTLDASPHTEEIQNIGILRLVGDDRQLTDLLAAKLTQLDRFRVVILGGRDWMAIENELARQDPEEGFGDIMDKASIKWREERDMWVIPETTKGADALLMGRVRSVDADWLRSRIRFTLHLARVDTREQIAGGIVEGEAVLTPKDFVIYYKIQILWGLAIFVAVIIVLCLLRSMLKSMTRPR